MVQSIIFRYLKPFTQERDKQTDGRTDRHYVSKCHASLHCVAYKGFLYSTLLYRTIVGDILYNILTPTENVLLHACYGLCICLSVFHTSLVNCFKTAEHFRQFIAT